MTPRDKADIVEFAEDPSARRVKRPSPDDAPRVVDVFCDAFHDYPVMRHVVGEVGHEYDRRLRKAGYEVVGHGELAPGLETWGFFRRD